MRRVKIKNEEERKDGSAIHCDAVVIKCWKLVKRSRQNLYISRIMPFGSVVRQPESLHIRYMRRSIRVRITADFAEDGVIWEEIDMRCCHAEGQKEVRTKNLHYMTSRTCHLKAPRLGDRNTNNLEQWMPPEQWIPPEAVKQTY